MPSSPDTHRRKFLLGLLALSALGLLLRLREPRPAAPPPRTASAGSGVEPGARSPRRFRRRPGARPRHPRALGGLSALSPLAALRGGAPPPPKEALDEPRRRDPSFAP